MATDWPWRADYFAIEVNALLRDRPQIIGHFDLLRKYAASLSLFHEADSAYRRLGALRAGARLPLRRRSGNQHRGAWRAAT